MERMTVAGVELSSSGMRITNADGIETHRYDVPPSPPVEVVYVDEDDAKAGFRHVLHEWAARQLTEKSGHGGPFEIVHVEMEQTDGSSISDSETWVHISFRHDGGGCEDSWKLRYVGGERMPIPLCEESSWMMPDTQQTIDMLNELLAIADER